MNGDAPDEFVVVGAAVITADSEGRVFEPGWVAVEGHHIAGVGNGAPPSDGRARVYGDVVMPGLVSAHQHLVDVIVRGGPTGPTFLDWLLGTNHGGVSLARPEECANGVATVRAAGLAAGVTTVVDCWSVGRVDDAVRVIDCADASVEAHRASGGRTIFAPMFCEIVPEEWMHGTWPFDPRLLCRPADESFAAIEAVAARVHGAHDARTLVAPSPELPELVTRDGLRAAAEYAAALGVVMPMHFCASPESRATCGPEDLAAIGLLDERLLAAHCHAVNDQDVTAIGAAHVGVVQCPSASFALGTTNLAPIAALRRAGARAGLGLDNASLTSSADLFAEGRSAQSASRTRTDPLDPAAVFNMLTREGASAIGLAAEIGSLVPGKRADLVLLDAGGAHWSPRAATWVDTVVTCARASDVRAVYVDGRLVARDGHAFAEYNPAELDRTAQRIAETLGWR